MTHSVHRELDALRAALLSGRPEVLPPDQGFEAFERHQLLAIRVHRAARLNAPHLTERKGWCLYFREHFPHGDEHAVLLWERWRTSLLKDETPGRGVAISHGQPHGHWTVFDRVGLFVNLESMWNDFAVSVDSFIALLARDAARRAAALDWWANRRWSVQPVYQRIEISAAQSASASGTPTAIV